MTFTFKKPHKAFALALGLSTAALLTACGGSDTDDTSSEVSIEDTAKPAASGADSLVTRCPDDKILPSQLAYNAIIFPDPESDYETWHAENGKRSDVTTTETGLQYKVVQDGLDNGASPVGSEVVTVHYHGYFPDGSVFDSSDGRDPLLFEVGSGMIIPGLDIAIPGMKVGDKKVVAIPADQAYGPEHPEARQAIPRSDLPSDIPQEVGTRLQMQNPEGQVVAVVIAEVTETDIVIDANHPLAGKDLTFAIEMIAIQPG